MQSTDCEGLTHTLAPAGEHTTSRPVPAGRRHPGLDSKYPIRPTRPFHGIRVHSVS